MKQIDIKTRKILTKTGHCHPNNDIDKLYVDKKSGGRGLRSTQSMCEKRLFYIRQHHCTKNEVFH